MSNDGANFLSSLIHEICKLLGVRKINSSGYHPQTDGLVEKFNSTLISMISKSCEITKRDWDDHLPYLLFAYRVSAQASSKELPFFLVHGRDARVPTQSVITHVRSSYAVDTGDYKEDLLSNLSTAWKLAKENLQKSQWSQKKQYDRTAKKASVRIGDRVMVHMPAESQGKDWKLCRPFHGPYRVLSVTPTNVEVRLVDAPTDEPIFVNLNQVHLCYPEQSDKTWTGPKRGRKKHRKSKKSVCAKSSEQPSAAPRSGPVTSLMSKNS